MSPYPLAAVRAKGNKKTAIATYTISGTITDGITPLAGVTVALGALTATTASNGTFTISNIPAGTSGALTPTKATYTFSPATITIPAMAGNLTSKSFTSMLMVFADEFTTARAVDTVNGTAAEPGPTLTRTVVDSAHHVTIHDGLFDISAVLGTPANYDPIMRTNSAIARAAGLTIFIKAKPSVTNKRDYVGFLKNTSYAQSNSISHGFDTGGTILANSYDGDGAQLMTGDAYTSQFYDFAVQCRANGYYWFQRIANRWKLAAVTDVGNTAALYIIVNGWENPIQVDFMRVAQCTLPIPLLSDGFSSAAATDGLGNPENNGGAGLTPTDWKGTFGVSGGKAQATVLDGTWAEAMRVWPLTAPNVMITATITRSAGNVGVVLMGRDSGNCLCVYHDGTRVKVDAHFRGNARVNIGQTGALAIGAGKMKVFVWRPANGQTFIEVDMNSSGYGWAAGLGVFEGELGPGLMAGVFTTDLGNTIDNLVIYPVGNDGQHDWMNAYTGETQTWIASEKFVVFDGNSMLAGANLATDVPFAVLNSLGSPYAGINIAVGGRTGATMLTDQHYANSYYNANRAKNILVYWEGLNDIGTGGLTGAQAYANTASYAAIAKALGFKFIVLTMSNWSTSTSERTNYNAAVIANSCGADVVVRVDQDPNIGDASNGTNLTYYQSVGSPHLTPAGYAIPASLIVTAIQGLG